MGLDYVELVLAIEERFKIHIPDEEASSVSTVGDLYNIVLSKIEPAPQSGPGRCLTSAAFYKTRRGFVDILKLQRRDVRPVTRLDLVLPWEGRRRWWKAIQSNIGLKMPTLHRPLWVKIGLIFVLAMLSMMFARVFALNLRDWNALAVLVPFASGSFGLLMWVTTPLAVGFPTGMVTVGDLAKGVLAFNYSRFLDHVGQQSRKEIWDVLCSVMVEQLGVSIEQIQSEAKIVDDLGIE